MSLYNMVMGVNPMAGEWLKMLDVTPQSIGRARDAWITDANGNLRIVVHTRCGGGNRGFPSTPFVARARGARRDT